MTKPVSVFDQIDQGVNPADPNAVATAQPKPVVPAVAPATAQPAAVAPPIRPANLPPRTKPVAKAPDNSLAAGEALAPGESLASPVETGGLGDAAARAAVPAPSLAGFDAVTLTNLVSLLMMREKREIEALLDAEERMKVRVAQRNKNARDKDSKLLAKQARCKHLKGGKGGPKTQNKDYAVSHHRFTNFVQYIRCLICGMKWYPGDTTEYLSRPGKNGKIHQISNHTHTGWREAVAMMDGSTNTLTASESMPHVDPNAAQTGFVDAAGLPVIPRVVDKDGNEVESVVL